MNKKIYLDLTKSYEQENKLIESFIRRQASNGELIHILEAGCGREWPFKLEGIKYILTGVDTDKEALKIRKNNLNDLHETIEGDLSSIDLGMDRYDMIYCSFVMEHIERADVVMRSFVKWLKPNGIIIIKIPDPYSAFGFVTRITPHWFHIFYYRILGKKSAGKPGYAPYPTYYHSVVSRRGMREFCNKIPNIIIEAEYGDGYWRPGRGTLKIFIHIIKIAINIMSIGSLSYKHTNLLYIIRKNNT
jgi:SAM-dependent methyltransferase